MRDAQIIEADWTWTGERFDRDVQVVVSADGMIDHVGMLDAKPTQRLNDRALLPGMINVHSHAFQRGLRGRGELFPDGPGSFWTWREAMYELVDGMDEDRFYRLSMQAFREMLACGVTSVGEFHYLRHKPESTGERDYALDDVILKAARDTGIRLVLIPAYYRTGDIGKPLSRAQWRFATGSVDDYFLRLDHLASRLHTPTQSLGAAVHSIRAASIDEIAALHKQCRERGIVFHMHVEEQRREIEACLQAHGRRPMALLNERLVIDEGFTAVHCTHTDRGDLDRFLAAGGNVCICPLTEANLGDGIADVRPILETGRGPCIGTDSNARLCMTEELRWLEYVQRLRHELRGVCMDDQGSVTTALWKAATIHGARSLGLCAGGIEAGRTADFVSIDVTAPPLVGWTPDSLLTSFLLGTGNEAVAATCVGGQWKPRF